MVLPSWCPQILVKISPSHNDYFLISGRKEFLSFSSSKFLRQRLQNGETKDQRKAEDGRGEERTENARQGPSSDTFVWFLGKIKPHL